MTLQQFIVCWIVFILSLSVGIIFTCYAPDFPFRVAMLTILWCSISGMSYSLIHIIRGKD